MNNRIPSIGISIPEPQNLSHNRYMTTIAKKSSKIIVYIGEFDKYDIRGKMLCRNTSCSSYPKAPYESTVQKNVVRHLNGGIIIIFIGIV